MATNIFKYRRRLLPEGDEHGPGSHMEKRAKRDNVRQCRTLGQGARRIHEASPCAKESSNLQCAVRQKRKC
ncbi:MAG: hypothetical protein IJ684_00715, partial [Bacteroidales bacterium]|nr:hypothetical protein [Bacteroidales bacterium]